MHGAFANRTPARRATLILQYNSRASALGACDPRNSQSMHRPGESPDAEPPHPPPDQLPEHLARRARMVALAIDARRQRFPAEHRSSTAASTGGRVGGMSGAARRSRGRAMSTSDTMWL